jgi:hypothetical protein
MQKMRRQKCELPFAAFFAFNFFLKAFHTFSFTVSHFLPSSHFAMVGGNNKSFDVLFLRCLLIIDAIFTFNV